MKQQDERRSDERHSDDRRQEWRQDRPAPEQDEGWQPEPVRRRRPLLVALPLLAVLAGLGTGYHYLVDKGSGVTTTDGTDTYPSGTWSVLSGGGDTWTFTVKDTSDSALTLTVSHRSGGTDCGTTGYTGTTPMPGDGVDLGADGSNPQNPTEACKIAPLTLIQDVPGMLETQLSDGTTLVLGSTLHPNTSPAAG